MLLSEMSVDQEVETLEKRNKVYKSFFRQELQIQKPRNIVFSENPCWPGGRDVKKKGIG